MTLFGLPHIEESQKSAANLHTRDFTDRRLCELRNHRSRARSRSRSYAARERQAGFATRVSRAQQIAFDSVVPAGVTAYSAHFKTDYLTTSRAAHDDYVVFCDINVMGAEEQRRNP
jgi:hypothetical protein